MASTTKIDIHVLMYSNDIPIEYLIKICCYRKGRLPRFSANCSIQSIDTFQWSALIFVPSQIFSVPQVVYIDSLDFLGFSTISIVFRIYWWSVILHVIMFPCAIACTNLHWLAPFSTGTEVEEPKFLSQTIYEPLTYGLKVWLWWYLFTSY